MALDLARWQFAIVTVFHFFFVPNTIGLALLTAVMQTLGHVRKDEIWMRLSRFFGRIFLISLAVGVVTGIVLEFEFGLNWSSYSVFVGNIFGAPLAIEALLAFFLESTFIGVWIFGRNKISPRLHLASIWLVSFGTMISALWILAANAWMQHPVGYSVQGGQAVLTDFWALLANSTLWGSFAHTIFAAFATGGSLMLGISVWRVFRAPQDSPEREAFRRATRFAGAFVLISAVLTAVAGDAQARLMDSQQPMKMAAAEALYDTANGASFSLLTIGDLSGNPVFQIRVPNMLSLIATLDWNGQVLGINQLQKQYTAQYGSGNYVPTLWLTYWSFRLMVGAGILMILLSAWGLWLGRRRQVVHSRWFRRLALAGIALPIAGNSAGWIFTEVGRQPWIVYGLMQTAKGVSPVSAGDVAFTLACFVAVYTALAAVAVVLVVRAARHPFEDTEEEPAESGHPLMPSLIY
jgi:cytochrome bd ubiquinol oxidase subunit I